MQDGEGEISKPRPTFRGLPITYFTRVTAAEATIATPSFSLPPFHPIDPIEGSSAGLNYVVFEQLAKKDSSVFLIEIY